MLIVAPGDSPICLEIADHARGMKTTLSAKPSREFDASAAQPISYLGLVYASLFGVLLYGESLTWNTAAGSVIVVGAGIFTFWREYVLRHQDTGQAA